MDYEPLTDEDIELELKKFEFAEQNSRLSGMFTSLEEKALDKVFLDMRLPIDYRIPYIKQFAKLPYNV